MKLFALIFSFALLAQSSQAAAIFSVTVDTSSISGTSGNVDFQLNPGGIVQSVTAFVTGFTTDGTLGAANPSIGDVTPMDPVLPATFTLGNSTGFNDASQALTFGNSIFFHVTLDGPAITAPDGGLSGSTFAFSLYNFDFTAALLTSDFTGAVAIINVGPFGVIEPLELPNGTAPSVANIEAVPEPATGLLVPAAGLFLLLGRRYLPTAPLQRS